jgi:hypothetical protein
MVSTKILMQPVLVVAVAMAGCGTNNTTPDAAPPVDALTMCIPNAPALTYSQLYTRYFATGTPGHCANEDCHGDTTFNSWSCGSNKDKCFSGMVGIGLIDTVAPLASRIANPSTSPIAWVNMSTGLMPADEFPRAFPEGRDAIQAWVRACATNN